MVGNLISYLRLGALCLLSLPVNAAIPGFEEVVVLADKLFKDTAIVSPTSVITAEQLQSINMTTVEDALAHEPSLIVRKRFIGDANGVIGLRGSNMFQTTRSMVFADGMPLHFDLQTRYRGAPRWSLVAPAEIERVEVIYGPYSSEYSGNAIGGVVNLTTYHPTSERLNLEVGYFSQQYDVLNTRDTYSGYRTFASYENGYDALGVFASYTRLENDSQPQNQLFAKSRSATPTATAVSGAVHGFNEFGDAGIYFADSGSEQATTELFKVKLFYDLESVQLRGSIAYEDRSHDESLGNNFLYDSSGSLLFDRRVEVQGKVYDTYQYGGSRLQNRTQQRDSLLLGLGASFQLTSGWIADGFYSRFNILEDVEVRSCNNPAAASYASDNARYRARITEYEDTGWQIFDLKLASDSLTDNDRHRLSLGVHYDQYELNYIVDDYNSIAGIRDSDELDGDAVTGRPDSGGEAGTSAVFAQYGYQLGDNWDLSVGLRYEYWQAENGFLGGVTADRRSKKDLSPKLSLLWAVRDTLEIRYSVAKALRFPFIEELFVNVESGGGAAMIADPTLEPEDGIFHNVSIISNHDGSSKRLNIFHEVIEDVIFNQRASNGVSTFLPVGEVTSSGVEWVWEQQRLFNTGLNLRYNLSYTDAEITHNVFNPSYVGNEFPRTARWRSNLLLSAKWSERLSGGLSIRYASESFGTLNNSDHLDNVFGAQDDFLFVGIKANWQASEEILLSAGIDNLFAEQAYVYHPWPGRTFHLKVTYQVGR
ncbi:MAG: iron complex outermembrane receptor protein [Parasphingorhabdus sp.]|jgi:iron complex outermembrane receptor protein